MPDPLLIEFVLVCDAWKAKFEHDMESNPFHGTREREVLLTNLDQARLWATEA